MTSRARTAEWVALLTVYFVWGSTYLGIKLAVRTLPALLVAGLRFLVASLLLAVILRLLGRSFAVGRRELLGAMALGLALLVLGVGLVHVAETHIDSSVAAMVAGSVPLQVVVWRLLARQRVRPSTALAATAGLVGLGLVVLPGGIGGGVSAIGLLTMLAASVSWSGGSFLSARLPLPADPFVATTIEMLTGGVVLTVVATALGDWGEISRDDLQAGPVAAWAYLAVFGSVVGFSAYAWLLHHAPISRVVTHQYVNPLVAIALGALFLDERPTAFMLVGAAVIIVAVATTLRSEASSGREPPTCEPEGAVPPGTRADPSG